MTGRTDTALLNWLEKHPECEVSYEGWDDESRWEVNRVIGGRNDREWNVVGQGETVREAISSAMQNMTQTRKRKAPENGK